MIAGHRSHRPAHRAPEALDERSHLAAQIITSLGPPGRAALGMPARGRPHGVRIPIMPGAGCAGPVIMSA
ncbi:hypothetical protein [Streptomyces sp. NPDC054854]